jgi:hypothetical protein
MSSLVKLHFWQLYIKLNVELVGNPHQLHFNPFLTSDIPKPGIVHRGQQELTLATKFLVAFSMTAIRLGLNIALISVSA